MDGMMGQYGSGGFIFMVLFWVGVILLIVWLIKQAQGRPSGEVTGESALDILKKRYARGEINKEEFEEKKKDLV